MKKIYIAPFCKIREVKKCDIIATSEIGLGDAKNSGSHDSASRGSLWDDDDWDED